MLDAFNEQDGLVNEIISAGIELSIPRNITKTGTA